MAGQLIDLDLLTRYDGKIKTLISTEDGKLIPKVTSPTAGHFVTVKADGTLEDAGESIAASKISVLDEGGLITATNVEGALAELATAAAGGVASKTIWGVDDSAGQSEYAKVYKIYQGANAPDAATDPATLKLTINLPKDKALQDADIVTITFDNGHLYDGVTDVTELIVGPSGTATAADAGKYMKFVMQNVTDPLYANLSDFIDIYTGGTTTEATVTVNGNNQITVAIGKINATKIVYREADATQGITEQTVKAKIDAMDTFVGSIPSGSSAATVVGYVDEKTTLATNSDIDNLFTT